MIYPRFSTWYFFDRPAVINAVGTAEAQVMGRQGAIVRGHARRLIRNRKGPSRPGAPPHSHIGHLKRLLDFQFDPGSRSVVIGPEKKGAGFYSAPEALEYGGKTQKEKNPRRVDRKVGDGGIVVIAGGKRSSKTGGFLKTVGGGTSKTVTDIRGKKRRVVFAKLITGKMVAHAEKLETEIYGPKVWPASSIEARPYMGPAFDSSKNAVLAAWRDAVR